MTWPSDEVLSAYLEEALPVAQLAMIERQLRDDVELRKRLATVIGRQDAGLHSVGVIWRRNRLSCPSRDQLGQYLLGVLDSGPAEYIRFHLENVGCRYCAANHDDLRSSGPVGTDSIAADGSDQPLIRRRRYFETSAGHLKRN
ncbi:MAG TPA: hypothetical protein DDZ51_05885 [Planctomycetaceae bacterium]|nr:hypothetical protein [Planctomycetaceae bacterium]